MRSPCRETCSGQLHVQTSAVPNREARSPEPATNTIFIRWTTQAAPGADMCRPRTAQTASYLPDAVLGCSTPTGRLAGKHITWTYGRNRDHRHKNRVLVVRLHIPQCGALRPQDNHNTWHHSPLSYNLCWPPCGEYTNTDAQPMQVPFTCESIHL